MNKEKYQKLTDKIIEAVPEIITNKHAQIIHLDHTVESFVQIRPITLEDVLVTIETKLNESELAVGDVTIDLKKILFDLYSRWELNIPFQDQSKETKELIGNLLT